MSLENQQPFKKTDNQNHCEHLLVDLCKKIDCEVANNHLICRRCSRTIYLPEVHYSGQWNEIRYEQKPDS